MLALVHVPQHHSAILSSGSAEGTIRGHGGGVHNAGVANQVGAQLAVVQVPHFHELVPASRHNQRHLGGRGEAD